MKERRGRGEGGGGDKGEKRVESDEREKGRERV
jgi:hypothetical protein